MENYNEFIKYFGKKKGGKFWKTITKDSLVPIGTIPSKDSLLKEIYSEVSESTYKPSKPRGYILIDKGGSIARLIPVFDIKDICVYFYCTKKVEGSITGNRVPNTYGGWSLGGELRKSEIRELKYISSSMREYEMPDGTILGFDESSEYSMTASFNPKAWKVNWLDFTGSIYTHSRTDMYGYVAELDIANFYDNISISALENKLKTTSADRYSINLLISFLKNWYDSTVFANDVYKGIPQDEVADCSRLIANFYLQDFDLEMFKLCDEYGAKYFRYADDQVILAQTEESLGEVIARASVMILKYGLCFNHRKTKIMDKGNFEEYFAFDWFLEKADKTSVDKAETKIDLEFYKSHKDKLRNTGVSVLLRILSLAPRDIDKAEVDILKGEIINKKFLSSPKLEVWQLEKLYSIICDEEKDELIQQLNDYALTLLHNRFHFILLQFFNNLKIDTKILKTRIEKLDTVFGLS
jgi:hypothetical protein